MNHDPIIIALDVDSAAEADLLVNRLGDAAGFYKVGMELFAAAGPDYVRSLIARGKRVFVDLKYYDIPETVKRATAVIAHTGATFLTVHAVPQVMRAAVAGRGESPLKLLVVTVLTSMNDADLAEMGHHESMREVVQTRVRQALECGVDGVVASPLEAHSIRSAAGPEALIVTPGVRSRGAASGDQKRVATPAEAVANGADYIVIGRQVTRASDPRVEVAMIHDELATG